MLFRSIRLIPAPGSEPFLPSDYTVSASTINLGSSGISNGVTICWGRCKVNTTPTGRFIFDVEIRDNGCPNVGIARQRVVLNVKSKENTKPLVTITGSSPNFNTTTLIGNMLVGDSLFIDFRGTDIDNDSISFSAEGIGFDFLPFGGKFTATAGKGTATAQFVMKANCNNITTNGQSDTLRFKFILKEGSGNCLA